MRRLHYHQLWFQKTTKNVCFPKHKDVLTFLQRLNTWRSMSRTKNWLWKARIFCLGLEKCLFVFGQSKGRCHQNVSKIPGKTNWLFTLQCIIDLCSTPSKVFWRLYGLECQNTASEKRQKIDEFFTFSQSFSRGAAKEASSSSLPNDI